MRQKLTGRFPTPPFAVYPVTYTLSEESMAISRPIFRRPLPPKNVDADKLVRSEENFETKTSAVAQRDSSYAPSVTGKLVDAPPVYPVTYTLSEESMAIPRP